MPASIGPTPATTSAPCVVTRRWLAEGGGLGFAPGRGRRGQPVQVHAQRQDPAQLHDVRPPPETRLRGGRSCLCGEQAHAKTRLRLVRHRYVVKRLITDVLVVFMGLFCGAISLDLLGLRWPPRCISSPPPPFLISRSDLPPGLWLVPTDMMGDRVAAILVAMLIVVTSLQSDLGLGKLSCAAYHPTRLPHPHHTTSAAYTTHL